ncbi:metallopeptidase TldD-related protein [Nakamurella endophytica]|uniref:Peptidase n=1 Tax=Nakamurella endophytica TaxID=1748367 RepID=A0A917SSW3_9ACTN|nr:metallopeptidase TldD-related protein [Nakamurella endophytica]GGL96134.1 peptidase [Nakamurella endophytica]
MTGAAGLPDLAGIVDRALAAASAATAVPTDDVVVLASTTSEANLRWANTTVTTNGTSESLSWTVVSVVGGATGTASGSVVDLGSPDGIEAVVRRSAEAARAAAAAGPSRDAASLVRPEEAGGSDAGWDAAPARTDFDVYRPLLDGLDRAFDAVRSADQVLYGFARHEVSTTCLGTSTGLRRRWVQPTGTLELNAKSADLSRSAWSGTSTADFADVDAAAVVAATAALQQRLDWARRRIELPAGRYDTVLPPTAVADFMVYLLWSAGARAAAEGHSAFSAPGGGTRIGERLTGLPLTLSSDPALPGLETAPFVLAGASGVDIAVFDNGAPVPRLDLVRDGTVAGLATTRRFAADAGLPFTPATDNVALTGGEDGCTAADLAGSLDRGLLVTSQWYLREVDPMTLLLTGLTRDGVFLVERGEIVGAVTNYRFNMSPLDVLRQAARVGTTERTLSREWSDWFTRSAMPPVLVEGFNMSSVSQAQ